MTERKGNVGAFMTELGERSNNNDAIFQDVYFYLFVSHLLCSATTIY